MDPFIEQIIKNLHEQAWASFISIIVGVITSIITGIIVPIILYIYDQNRLSGRVIAYRVVKKSLSIDQTYGVVCIFRWRLWNYGKESISPQHYLTNPVEITFGSNARVRYGRVYDRTDSLITPQISLPGDKVVLEPLFLNSKDAIILEFMVQLHDFVQTSLRIDGMTIDGDKEREKLFEYGVKLRKGVFIVFVAWLLCFFAQLAFNTNLLFHYTTIVLAFCISALVTLRIMYLLFPILRYR